MSLSGQELPSNATMDQMRSAALSHSRDIHAQVFHPDHEHLHAIIAFSLLFLLVAAQTGVWWWRAVHPRSFQRATLLGAWLVPPTISFVSHFWRFLAIWGMFSVAMMYVVKGALSRPLAPHAPKMVYGFFLRVHQAAQFVAGFGYVVLMVEFFGGGALAQTWLGQVLAEGAMLLIFYGLYFGLLGRDAAELCAERMAVALGYGHALVRQRQRRKRRDSADDADLALPSGRVASDGHCGICTLRLVPALARDGNVQEEAQPVLQLACGDSFHESCVRGWTIVGKKDVCPGCAEKVRFDTTITTHPWQRTSEMWAQLLDAIGVLVVWNPLIILGLQIFVFLADR